MILCKLPFSSVFTLSSLIFSCPVVAISQQQLDRHNVLVSKSEERWQVLTLDKRNQIVCLSHQAYQDLLIQKQTNTNLPESFYDIKWEKIDREYMVSNDLDLWIDNIPTVVRTPEYRTWEFRAEISSAELKCEYMISVYEAVFRPTCWVGRVFSGWDCGKDQPLEQDSHLKMSGQALFDSMIAKMTGVCIQNSSQRWNEMGWFEQDEFYLKPGTSSSEKNIALNQPSNGA